MLLLTLLLLVSMLLNLSSGGISLSGSDLLSSLSPQQSLILWEIRLPRTLMAAIVGDG